MQQTLPRPLDVFDRHFPVRVSFPDLLRHGRKRRALPFKLTVQLPDLVGFLLPGYAERVPFGVGADVSGFEARKRQARASRADKHTADPQPRKAHLFLPAAI